MGSGETSVLVSGVGRTKKAAFADAMSKIQSQLSDKIAGYLIRIEPLEVSVVDGKEIVTTERFLFLFLKRDVSRFELRLCVKVRYFEVDVEGYDCRKVRADDSIFGLSNDGQGSFF